MDSPTPSLDWTSTNLPDAHHSFEQYCFLIFEGPFTAKTENEKVTYLLLWIGRHGRDVHNGWTWTDEADKYKVAEVFKHFREHIEPKVNSYLARYNFHQCRQTAEESVDEFMARFHVLAAKCKFADVLVPCGWDHVCWKSVIEPSFFEDGVLAGWIVRVISIC